MPRSSWTRTFRIGRSKSMVFEMENELRENNRKMLIKGWIQSQKPPGRIHRPRSRINPLITDEEEQSFLKMWDTGTYGYHAIANAHNRCVRSIRKILKKHGRIQ